VRRTSGTQPTNGGHQGNTNQGCFDEFVQVSGPPLSPGN
jgi:hypothetical protein